MDKDEIMAYLTEHGRAIGAAAYNGDATALSIIQMFRIAERYCGPCEEALLSALIERWEKEEAVRMEREAALTSFKTQGKAIRDAADMGDETALKIIEASRLENRVALTELIRQWAEMEATDASTKSA